jgi:penicillin-binding protein 1B
MGLRIRIAPGFWTSRTGIWLLASAATLLLLCLVVFTYYYIQFGRLIDQRLTGQEFENTSHVYSAPLPIFIGERLRPEDLAVYLARAGYTEADVAGAPGRYHASGSSVEIRPGERSYFAGGNPLRVDFSGGSIVRLTALSNGAPLVAAEVEPSLLTNLFDSAREKRRLVRYQDLPPVMINAVLAAEDKRFFEHAGFDPIRVLGAAWADLRGSSMMQGASTLDMQVARSFFFTTKREWRRKIKETMVALELEHRFTKQQIFELYANEIYLGNRGSFAIRGFGEAAEAYFGKDVRQLDAGEAAFLAGIIRAPNRYAAAERHPDRAIEARDRVLGQMVENNFLTAAQADAARKQKLKFAGGGLENSAAPYFVDMVKDHLLEDFSENDLTTQSFRIYTTLDPDLERAANEAIDLGMKNVDAQLARRYDRWRRKGEDVPRVQLALVALDPHTGEIRALVGGRNYGESQLNHILARRQPGSAFKPFVYAAAFDNAVDGLQPVVTPVTTVVDEPTTFSFDGKDYTPNNYGEQFYGTVTLRDALIHSLNVATVKVAEMVGYGRVVEMARRMGLDPHIQATPAVALGAYEMTPLEVAAGYTAFGTGGVRAEPEFLLRVVGADGTELERGAPRTRAVLDPRVAYLVTNLLQDVINRGTGSVVRARGLTVPAAGKTGTSRDAWFAGFTSNLVCVVWVGFDDNRDVGLSGAVSAAPIWAEFMKRAVALPRYHNAQAFLPPAGIAQVTIDPQTGQLATPNCPITREEVFISGTEPTVFCELHGGRSITQTPPASWLSHLFGKQERPSPPGPTSANGATPQASPDQASPDGSPAPAAPEEQQKKKGLLQRIFGIFGSSKKTTSDTTPKQDQKPEPKPNP